MKGEKGFDDAQGDMKEAEGDLKGGGQGKAGKNGQGGKGAAVDAQGRALEALRDGAQGLQKQMDGQGQGKGKGRNGKGNYVSRRSRPGEMPSDDPLGRGAEGEKGREDGPLKGSASAAERARRVMEELRRRPLRSRAAGGRARLPRTADEAGLWTLRAALGAGALPEARTPEPLGSHCSRA